MMASAPEAHPFDEAVALAPHGDGIHTGHTTAAYANMVGPFGGVIGASLLNAVMTDPQRLGDPVSLTVHYAAPIADGAFSVTARAMRTNRSTQHWLVEMAQDEQIVAFATAVTALRRETWGATDARFPDVPPAESLEQAAPVERAPWTRCYEMRFVDGAIGGRPNDDIPSQSRLWLRDNPPRPLDFVSLAALCDAFFPRIFVPRGAWTPIGTVTLTTYFHADAEQVRNQGTGYLLGSARGLNFGKGFFDQSAEVWSTDGSLLASSHQVVYYKE